MPYGRLAHQIDRWKKRPRFRTPATGILLLFLILAALFLLLDPAEDAPAPEPAPPPVARPEPEPPPAPTPVQLPEEAPPAEIPEESTEEGCPDGCAVPPPGCDIKGNISYKTGEKIYHVPNGEFYGRTEITPGKGEAWFCTEGEARANGWRKSKR